MKDRKKEIKKIYKLEKYNNKVEKLNYYYKNDSDIKNNESGKKIKGYEYINDNLKNKTQQITKNLRIREDLPKYLRNLDPESAFYDPKSRSMRENPYYNRDIITYDDYIGDNFISKSGGSIKFNELLNFTKIAQKLYEIKDIGNILLNSNPTNSEITFLSHLKTKTSKKNITE